MSQTLSDLVAQLQDDVPTRSSIPTDTQYERCVMDSVLDFGRRTGRRKIVSISVESGTATYDLPDDFLKVIKLVSIMASDHVLNTAQGLVPVSQSWEETYTIADGQITFYPTPTYTIGRELHYQAGWVLDASNIYQELGDEEAQILLQLAASKALKLQANKAAQEAWGYQLGDERVSKEKLAAELRTQAKANEDSYREAIRSYNGPIGSRASYASDAYK